MNIRFSPDTHKLLIARAIVRISPLPHWLTN